MLRFTNLQNMKRVQSGLQVVKFAVPLLQSIDFLLQLVKQLLSTFHTFLLRHIEFLDELRLVSLDSLDEQGANLSTPLNLPLCDLLLIRLTKCEFREKAD